MEKYVRLSTTCPNCTGPKDKGLVVCWPCHREQKQKNGGGYSRELERKIELMEMELTLMKHGRTANGR